jgi:hypothetical protein
MIHVDWTVASDNRTITIKNSPQEVEKMRKFIGTIGLLVCIMLLPPVASAKSNSSNLNRERLEVGRALIEVTIDNLDSIIPYYTDDIEYHDPIVDVYGIEDMTDFLYRLFGSTPDLVTTVEDEIAIDGMYTATWTMQGTFIADPSDPVNSGVPYEAKGMSIIKFRDKSTDVYYQRDYYTEGDIMIAIPGLDQAVGGFRAFYRCAVDPTFSCPF